MRIVNFEGNVSFTPKNYYTPKSEQEALDILNKRINGAIWSGRRFWKRLRPRGDGVLMSMKQTIQIMGAGPSGLAAAINLAKAGYKVSVFERRQDCGWRFGGDLQGLENWSYKEDVITSLSRMNISINFYFKPFSTLMVTNGSKTFDLHFTKPLVYLLKRGIAEGNLYQRLKQQNP